MAFYNPDELLDPIVHHLLRELQSRDHEIFDPI